MLPQLDFSTYFSQIFWLLLCFALVLVFIKYRFLPRMEGVLSERRRQIEADVTIASENNKAAQAALERASEALHSAHEESEKLIFAAILDAKQKTHNATEAMAKATEVENKRIQGDIDNALKSFESVRRDAVFEVAKAIFFAITPANGLISSEETLAQTFEAIYIDKTS